jgi:hypothetical protein
MSCVDSCSTQAKVAKGANIEVRQATESSKESDESLT